MLSGDCCQPNVKRRKVLVVPSRSYKHTSNLCLADCSCFQDISGGSSIPDGTKDSLKAALSVLGVSHDGVTHNSEEHNVFVLGLDAEDLREVVSDS